VADRGIDLGVRSAVVDLPQAAQILGIGRTLAYRLVREGRWPTPVIRVGRLIKVPVRPLYEYIDRPGATVA
jgi:predicted site-specific integrase-resolvase